VKDAPTYENETEIKYGSDIKTKLKGNSETVSNLFQAHLHNGRRDRKNANEIVVLAIHGAELM
jgi:hypothetical protein